MSNVKEAEEIGQIDLEAMNRNLDEQIKDKKIILDNLNSKIRDINILSESDRKYNELKDQKAVNIDRINLSNKESKLNQREDTFNLRESHLKEREIALEKREKEYLDLEKKKESLVLERAEFLRYKKSFDSEFSVSKDIMEQSKHSESSLNQRRSDLDNREILIVKKEDYLNRHENKLNEEWGKLKIEQANFEAMQKEKEDALVK